MSTTGRPPVLTAEKQVLVCHHVAAGASLRSAAQSVGCASNTISNTARRDPHFHRRLQHAAVAWEMENLKRVRQAKNWRAAAWALERTRPERYARRPSSALSPDKLRALLGQLAERLAPHLTEPGRLALDQALADLAPPPDELEALLAEEPTPSQDAPDSHETPPHEPAPSGRVGPAAVGSTNTESADRARPTMALPSHAAGPAPRDASASAACLASTREPDRSSAEPTRDPPVCDDDGEPLEEPDDDLAFDPDDIEDDDEDAAEQDDDDESNHYFQSKTGVTPAESRTFRDYCRAHPDFDRRRFAAGAARDLPAEFAAASAVDPQLAEVLRIEMAMNAHHAQLVAALRLLPSPGAGPPLRDASAPHEAPPNEPAPSGSVGQAAFPSTIPESADRARPTITPSPHETPPHAADPSTPHPPSACPSLTAPFP